VNLDEAGRRGMVEARDGPPSSQALVRTFGGSESQIRLTLFRDNHAWCPYCHKVWLQLEEKKVPYRVEKINMHCYGAKKRSFLQKTPRGLLPAIELDGKFHIESGTIMQLIEDAYPEHARLMPPRGRLHDRAKQLMNLERSLFGEWLQWLHDDDSARRGFEEVLDITDRVLGESGGPFFLGKDVSLVDCVFASTLERVAASIYYYKGLRVRNGRWTHVDAWFAEMEKRESYKAARSDFHTHVHDLPPQIGGCVANGTPAQRAAAAAVDGTDGRSWHLPLPPLTADSAEPAEENVLADRLEAAGALVHCREGVVRSSQGGGSADEAFRYVAQALIEGVDKTGLVMGAVDPAAAKSLRHTRDRICVPRDMGYTAARQLRAHLNWAADLIDPADRWQGTPISTRDRRDTDPAIFHGSVL